jgi:hypothetical protein
MRSYQTDWNYLIIHTFKNIKSFRYYFINHILIGLVQSNYIELDFGYEFVRFFINTIKDYLTNENKNIDNINLKKSLMDTIPQKKNVPFISYNIDDRDKFEYKFYEHKEKLWPK